MKAGGRSAWGLKGGIGCRRRAIVRKGKLRTEEGRERWCEPRGQGGVQRRQNGFEEIKECLESCDGVRDLGIEGVTVVAEMGVGADSMEVMEGAWKGRDMGEGAERTGGERGGDVVWAVWVMGENFVMMLCMVPGGDMEETDVTESSKVMKKLDSWRSAEGLRGIVEIRIVLGYPT